MSQLGHSRRDWLRATIGPRPLRPESDHSRHESEMARWASNGLMRRSKKAQSFDNLVGSHKQGWRHRKPKRFRGLEVDDH
jgi:hypothetical protein